MFARIYRKATKWAAAGFLKSLIRTVPYRIHTILTDNGVQFVQREQGTSLTFPHIFGRVALENDIEHRLTKPYHPWTNGQAERMVRTIKEGEAEQELIRRINSPLNVKSFHYSSINEMRRHMRDWLTAYNFAKQLKALKFKTPYEAIQELWIKARGLYRQSEPSHARTKQLVEAFERFNTFDFISTSESARRDDNPASGCRHRRDGCADWIFRKMSYSDHVPARRAQPNRQNRRNIPA